MRQQQTYNKSTIFSERLRKLRGNASQADFAKQLGIATQQTYANYEAGRVPKQPILQQIAQRCGVTVAWLLGEVPEMVSKESSAISEMTSKGLLTTLLKYLELLNDPSLTEMKKVHVQLIADLAKELSTRPEEEWVEKNPNQPTIPKQKAKYTE